MKKQEKSWPAFKNAQDKVFHHPRGLGGLINEGYFKNDIPYPNKKDFKVKYTCEHCGSKVEDAKAEEMYTNALKEYRAEDARLYQLFKKVVMHHYGLEGLKEEVYEKTWSIAWEQGHSAGYHEVYSCLADLADLMILTIEKE